MPARKVTTERVVTVTFTWLQSRRSVRTQQSRDPRAEQDEQDRKVRVVPQRASAKQKDAGESNRQQPTRHRGDRGEWTLNQAKRRQGGDRDPDADLSDRNRRKQVLPSASRSRQSHPSPRRDRHVTNDRRADRAQPSKARQHAWAKYFTHHLRPSPTLPHRPAPRTCHPPTHMPRLIHRLTAPSLAALLLALAAACAGQVDTLATDSEGSGSGGMALGGSSSGGADGPPGNDGGSGGTVCTEENPLADDCREERKLRCSMADQETCDETDDCHRLYAARIDVEESCADPEVEYVGCGDIGCHASEVIVQDPEGNQWRFADGCIPYGWTEVRLSGIAECE